MGEMVFFKTPSNLHVAVQLDFCFVSVLVGLTSIDIALHIRMLQY